MYFFIYFLKLIPCWEIMKKLQIGSSSSITWSSGLSPIETFARFAMIFMLAVKIMNAQARQIHNFFSKGSRKISLPVSEEGWMKNAYNLTN